MEISMKSNMNNSEQFKIGNSKNSNLKISAQPGQPLLTNELAVALGVSFRFIYQMRARGFLMRGDTRRRQMATLEQARAWIRANNFRLHDGIGVTDATITNSPAKPQTEGRAALLRRQNGRDAALRK
jgi:hypothetical protein